MFLASEIDREIAALSPASLSADRDQPTPFAELFATFDLPESDQQSVLRIADAHLSHFPETIFWDYDHVVSFVVRTRRPSKDVAEDFVALFAKYGRHSNIAFRYVHDFFLGFDWIKWVNKGGGSPLAHPFSEGALAYLFQRGDEIERLIELDDRDYPTLPDGVPRNAYKFSREPADERQLLQTLARRALIPLPIWDADAEPVFDVSILSERERIATELGYVRR